jgi:4-hydroxy-tetrahydrodipicolinate synthase
MIALAPDFLTGSYPPLVTPFRDGRVDYETYARLIEFQITNGTHGLVVNGTTSEPTSLTMDERNQLVRTAVQVAGGRVPVVAQTGSQSHAETCALTDFAQQAGADAIMVLTPFFIRAPQRGVVAYFEDVARHTDRPLLMYHIPGRSAFKVELDTLVRIGEAVPHFAGIKHALDDHGFVTQMIARLGPDFRIFVGLEEFTFPMMAIGAQGTMNAVANLAPRQVADLCNHVRAGNLASGRKLHFELYDLMCAVFWDTNPIAMKYMMKRVGLIDRNEHRLPLVPATPELERRLDALLERVGLAKA